MEKRIFILLVLALFLAGCEGKVVSQEDAWLETRDNVKIYSTIWYSRGDKAVILLHMLDRDRDDWRFFANKLNVFRISAIGIDLRGHGESDGDWNDFSDRDFLGMVYDVEAAQDKLEKEGKKVVGIVGADIGADLALKYAVRNPDIRCLVLLSPGIAYKSINVEEDIGKLDIPVFVAASSEDAYPYESAEIIYEKLVGEKEIFRGEGLGHGSDMLLRSEELQNKVFDFLNKNLK